MLSTLLNFTYIGEISGYRLDTMQNLHISLHQSQLNMGGGVKDLFRSPPPRSLHAFQKCGSFWSPAVAYGAGTVRIHEQNTL